MTQSGPEARAGEMTAATRPSAVCFLLFLIWSALPLPDSLLFSFSRMDLFLGLPSSQCETLRGQWRGRSFIKAYVKQRSLVVVPVASVPWLHGSWTIPGLTSCPSAQAVLLRKHMEPRRLGFILATCELDGSRQVTSRTVLPTAKWGKIAAFPNSYVYVENHEALSVLLSLVPYLIFMRDPMHSNLQL